jgi:hypothetical protein
MCQATVHFVVAADGPEDEALRTKLCVGSFVQVLLQILTAGQLYVATFLPSCKSNDQCERTGKGAFCSGSYCDFCGIDWGPTPPAQEDPATGELWNGGSDMYAGYNVSFIAEWCMDPGRTEGNTNWCESCFHLETMHVDPSLFGDITNKVVQSMRVMDWLTLTLAGAVAAMTTTAELRDITFCKITFSRATIDKSSKWCTAIRLLGWLRRWVFLPFLVATVPFVVYCRAADSLSICFNTVAVLFLCEVDNAAYLFLLGERTRMRVEQRARIKLTDEEAATLARSKFVYMCNITVCIIVAVALAGYVRADPFFWAISASYVAFMFGGIFDDGLSPTKLAANLGHTVLGMVLFMGVTGLGFLSDM